MSARQFSDAIQDPEGKRRLSNILHDAMARERFRRAIVRAVGGIEAIMLEDMGLVPKWVPPDKVVHKAR